ncbi:MAG: efflux RND transporter periplasmic adaptor subunit [Chitinophagaceae bacterium]|nr:MAG: efflux RND transporter periplasmic adaptor subunit [Chitinophagaceae bacterium]
MKKRSLIRLFITIVLLAGVTALIAAVLTNNKKKNEAKTAVVAQGNAAGVAVRVSSVKADSLSTALTANGYFEAKTQIDLSSKSSGRIERILVEEGSVVRTGQVLAIIDADDLSVEVNSAEANYQTALKDKQRYENAFATGGVTRQQVDQATLALNNAQARLSTAKIRASDATIRSSINGIVNKKYIESGSVVAPGTKLFEVVDVSKLVLRVNVTEAQVAALKTGDRVNVRASAFPDREFAGRVTFIAARADEALNFPIEIEIPTNKGNALRAGMYGTAVFNFPGTKPVIQIPRTAFVGSVSSNQVYVMTADSTAALKTVVAGRVLGDKVEVLDGLKEEELVITSGQVNLSQGAKVNVIR